MNGAEWLSATKVKREVDMSWLSPRAFDVHPMFETAPPPPPPKSPAPPPPKAPPPPPGPSPEDLARIAEADQVLRLLADSLETLADATHREVGKIAEEIFEMSLAVAEELAGGAIDTDPERIIAIVIQALEMLGTDQPVRVILNPSVYDALRKRGLIEKISSKGGLTLVPEPKLTDTGCVIESPMGRVDARVQSRLRQLRRLFEQKMGVES